MKYAFLFIGSVATGILTYYLIEYVEHRGKKPAGGCGCNQTPNLFSENILTGK